ncbi:MAG TPA: hypothetical protein VFC03_04770 [Acidimicrobiales bacterium]|nr:hypothetical protein [Acidimicrobiales bacterium]
MSGTWVAAYESRQLSRLQRVAVEVLDETGAILSHLRAEGMAVEHGPRLSGG